MPDLDWNLHVWNEHYDWEKDGDEWSVAWGGARAQWFGSIYPRVHRLLPANRILEIAPGRGRWTQFLLPHCVEYVGVDLSEKCVQACKQRFSAATRARFHQNDGRSLAIVPDASIDLVFSLDSLVHVESDVLGEYIWQICQKLTPSGVAFIHHSNALSPGCRMEEARTGSRGETVSSAVVKELVEDCSAVVRIQEEVPWVGASRTDCFTLFGRATAFSDQRYMLLENDHFATEIDLVRRFQSHYGDI